VGRTARFDKDGKALLFLTPSERKFVQLLEEKRVPITETEANASRLQSISGRLQSLNAEDPNLKYLAQKSFISYMRSVFLQSDKDVFKVDALPADAYAIALGLPIAPKIKFLRVCSLGGFPKQDFSSPCAFDFVAAHSNPLPYHFLSTSPLESAKDHGQAQTQKSCLRRRKRGWR
jgi:ATP-dependent RNA helicase DDX10/DBP4